MADGSRAAQREQLLTLRATLAEREHIERALQQRVEHWLDRADVHAVGFFWPIRGEPDLRDVLSRWLQADPHRVAALPVVDGVRLVFHSWTCEAPMRAGVHGIAVPAHGRLVQPDCLLIPCVGVDEARYRLGYGGGYYDRTLAALVPWPLAVGVAFEATRVATISPRPHDIQLDMVLTDAGEY